MANLITAQVTLPYHELQALQDGLHKAENEAAALRAQLADAEVSNPDVARLVLAIRAARQILALALQYIPHAQWPVADLLTFANVFEHLPGGGPDDQVVAIDFRDFVKELSDEREQLARIRERNVTTEGATP